MKRMKKFAGFLLAMIMVLAMTVAASAENFTITGPDNNHTYEVYQIFTGDLHGGVLSNVKWGKNGTGTEGNAVNAAVLTELQEVSGGTDVAKLEVITKYASLTAENKFGTVTKNLTLTAPAGYYLIKDVDNELEGADDSYTLYIVQVVDNITISPKADKPSSEKKVKDVNDSVAGSTSGWQDSADYDIGDEISYQLTATLPNNVSDYETYSLSFVDTMSAGLTYKAGSAVVKVDGVQANTLEPARAACQGTESAYAGGTVLTWNLGDVKAAPYNAGNGKIITIEYTATLNVNAVIGSAGNPNMMHIEYSNNPNGTGTGKTPDDTNIVFTYKTVVNKVQENPDFDASKEEGEGNQRYIPLEGAGFTLYKKNSSGEYELVGGELKGEGMTTFTFSGLDDGDYRLAETTTPAGYNTIAPIEFTITAEHDVVSDNPALTSLSGAVTSGTATFTSATSDGSLTTDVVNQKGATLPETGGIGTTIFYVLGTILVIGAGLLLVTKKRMGADK